MRRYEYIFFQRRHTDGQKTQEKMLTITNYSGNASQNQSEMSPHTCCCCSVTQSCLTLCNPMNCSTPGFPVLHYLWSLLKLVSIESMMPSNHLILCPSLLLLPSIFPSIRVFSNFGCIRQPKCWSFSFSISLWGFPGSSDHKSSAYNAGDLGSIPGLGRSPGEGNGNPLQYSCLENPMDHRAW